MIHASIVVSGFQENCYILASEKTKNAFVIDPGEEADRIIAYTESKGLKLKRIINTHCHVDHVGAVKELKEKLDIPFHIHKDDEDLLNALPQQAAMFGLNTLGVPEIDGYFEDGDVLEVDDLQLKVIHTPGHSRGGVCFYNEDEKVLIAGDTLFQDSIGRTDLPGGSLPQLLGSIKDKLFTLDGETVVYPGHGPSTTIEYEKYNNPFLQG